MFKDFFGLAETSLFTLPQLAMCIFLAMFIGVVVRVCQRTRRPQYDRMAQLPLNDDTGNGGHDDN